MVALMVIWFSLTEFPFFSSGGGEVRNIMFVSSRNHDGGVCRIRFIDVVFFHFLLNICSISFFFIRVCACVYLGSLIVAVGNGGKYFRKHAVCF